MLQLQLEPAQCKYSMFNFHRQEWSHLLFFWKSNKSFHLALWLLSNQVAEAQYPGAVLPPLFREWTVWWISPEHYIKWFSKSGAWMIIRGMRKLVWCSENVSTVLKKCSTFFSNTISSNVLKSIHTDTLFNSTRQIFGSNGFFLKNCSSSCECKSKNKSVGTTSTAEV